MTVHRIRFPEYRLHERCNYSSTISFTSIIGTRRICLSGSSLNIVREKAKLEVKHPRTNITLNTITIRCYLATIYVLSWDLDIRDPITKQAIICCLNYWKQSGKRNDVKKLTVQTHMIKPFLKESWQMSWLFSREYRHLWFRFYEREPG